MVKKQIVVDADVYDALELSALVFRGIGAGIDSDYSAAAQDAVGSGIPVCAYGHLNQTGVDYSNRSELREQNGGILASKSDAAVRAINARKGKTGDDLDQRVSWEEYVAEMGWVRGPHPTEQDR